VVFDLGANAGATTYFFSRLVGLGGKVFAFEPDEESLQALRRNIEHHSLDNVTVIKRAVAGRAGERSFSAGAGLASGFSQYVAHPEAHETQIIQAVSLQGACEELGIIPTFIKMDIEGAELEVVKSSLKFFQLHPIRNAIEAHGENIVTGLEKLFSGIGYGVEVFSMFGQKYIWAEPPALHHC